MAREEARGGRLSTRVKQISLSFNRFFAQYRFVTLQLISGVPYKVSRVRYIRVILVVRCVIVTWFSPVLCKYNKEMGLWRNERGGGGLGDIGHWPSNHELILCTTD